MAETVLVTGATGKIGTELCHLLALSSAGHRVRAATRDPEGPRARLLQALRPQAVVPVAIDLDDPASVAQAAQGVTAAVLILPVTPGLEARHRLLAETLRAAGCNYVVKVSVTGARAPDSELPPGPLPAAHWAGEEVLRQSALPYTAIRPTIFMQHFQTSRGLYVPGADRFYLPTGDAGIAFVDCRDVARCAAALIGLPDPVRSRWHGQAFELTGPAAVTAAEIAELLSAAAGRPIAHVDGMAAYEARCAELGVPDRLKAVYADAAAGWFGAVEHQAYTAITGLSPTPFAKYALDHAAFFGGAGAD